MNYFQAEENTWAVIIIISAEFDLKFLTYK